MAGFIAIVGACTAVGGLAIGASAHLSRPRMLPAALRRHGLLPTSLVAPIAIAVTTAEAGLAATATVALLIGSAGVLGMVLWAAACLFMLYGGYARYVTAKGRGGPCGCSHAEVPMDDWVTVRAIAFGACATGGAMTAGTTPIDAPQWIVAALATATLTLVVWQLPAAMRQPTPEGASAWTS